MATGATGLSNPNIYSYTGPTGPYEMWYKKQHRLTYHLGMLNSEINRIENIVQSMGGTGMTGATGARVENAMNQINFIQERYDHFTKIKETITTKIDDKMTDDELDEIDEINVLFNDKYKYVLDNLVMGEKSRRDNFFYLYISSCRVSRTNNLSSSFRNRLLPLVNVPIESMILCLCRTSEDSRPNLSKARNQSVFSLPFRGQLK